jgi:hypothetical protein
MMPGQRTKFINYSNYTYYGEYRMTSSIQLSKETKTLISTFGTKEETYEDIIKRLYKIAVKEQLKEFLMSSDNTITLEEAKKRHSQKWSE